MKMAASHEKERHQFDDIPHDSVSLLDRPLVFKIRPSSEWSKK
jgi:hypothetical protein